MHHHRSITEWLRGEMSSADLLSYLDYLPETSAFKTWAERGGEWPAEQVVQVRIANELMAARADGKGYTPEWIQTPGDMQAEEEREAARMSAWRQAQDELMGKARRRRKAVS